MVSPIVLVIGLASVLILNVAGKPDVQFEKTSYGSKKIISPVKAEDVPKLVKELAEKEGSGGSNPVSAALFNLLEDEAYQVIEQEFGDLSDSDQLLAVHEEETKFKESKDVVVEVGFPKHGLDNDAVITYFKVTAVQVNKSKPSEVLFTEGAINSTAVKAQVNGYGTKYFYHSTQIWGHY